MFFIKKLEKYNFVDFFKFINSDTKYMSFKFLLNIISIIVVMFIISNINIYFIRSFFFSLIWFFTFYWFMSIFIFLFKKSQYNVFNTPYQRFWKKSLLVFWGLEVNLFMIYIYLTFIAPQEALFMADKVYTFFSYSINFESFFQEILNLLIIVLLGNILIIAHKFNTFVNVIKIILLSFLFLTLQEDLNQFLSISQFYSNCTWNWDTDDKIWKFESQTLKLRTFTHYFYLLIFLKFWHTIFIIFFFLFFEVSSFFTKNSFNVYAANLQNFYFLFFFGFVLKIMCFRGFLSYYGEYIYHWFFITHHFYDFRAVYNIFSFKYMFFIFYDFF